MRPEHRPVAPGSRVAVIFPSGPPSATLLQRSLALVTAWGLVPVLPPDRGPTRPHPAYLSAPDDERAAELQWAWCAPDIDAVFCARGGYGSVRILDRLDEAALRSAVPKPIFGSSDATGIAQYWLDRLGVGFWFAPMLATVALLDDADAVAGLHSAVFDGASGEVFDSAVAESLVRGEASGRLVGGNLSLLAMTVGATSRPATDNRGAIALLEDVTEQTYRIDGMLTTLLRSGWFDGVAGIALGSWKDCSPLAEIRDLAVELLAPLGVPLVWELGFGHGPAALSVPLGARATIVADDHPRLIIADR